jgi:hypothetical protein
MFAWLVGPPILDWMALSWFSNSEMASPPAALSLYCSYSDCNLLAFLVFFFFNRFFLPGEGEGDMFSLSEGATIGSKFIKPEGAAFSLGGFVGETFIWFAILISAGGLLGLSNLAGLIISTLFGLIFLFLSTDVSNGASFPGLPALSALDQVLYTALDEAHSDLDCWLVSH